MSKPAVLIANGDEGSRRVLPGLLLREGYDVVLESNRSTILEHVWGRGLDLIILVGREDDTRDGLGLAREIRRADRALPIILIAAYSTEELAIAALKAGVTDYFKRPIVFDEVIASVKQCLADSALALSSGPFEVSSADLIDGVRMVGDSRAACAVRAQIAKVASTDSTVLILGETGTGKELAAQLIHQESRRRHRPLVVINCAAIPDSLLESELFGYERGAFTGAQGTRDGKLRLADGGTAFLDEIGDMSPYAQAKVLRAIETKEVYRLGGGRCVPVDARVIAATNRDLEPLVGAGAFRKDLYFRLNVVRVHLPPLRERRQDIPPLVDYYVRDVNRRLGVRITGITLAALEALVHYDWPGNVRELKNLLEAVAVNRPSGKIFGAHLPEHIRRRRRESDPRGSHARDETERDRVLAALFQSNWNKWKAAEELHWSRMTLYRKMAKYHIRSDRSQRTLEPGAGL